MLGAPTGPCSVADTLRVNPVTSAEAATKSSYWSRKVHASTVHPAHAHISRPERYTADKGAFPGIQEQGKKSFFDYLKQIDGKLAGRQWVSDQYSVADPYAFTFYTWGVRRELPMAELKNYSAHKDRMLQRAAVKRVVEDEKVKV